MPPVLGQSPEWEPSASDFGGVGLFQTRTARFWRDGQADVAFSRVFPYDRYNLSLQALPWLEATFRYTSILNRSFDGGSSVFSGSSFKDRAFDAKALLLRETRFRPQIAVGFQDVLGTGLFAGEYIVASKRWFDFDVSAGLGWGYLAGTSEIRNPLISLSDGFKSRVNTASQGGQPTVGAWFSGANIGIFGGVEYQTPIKGLALKVEYDPNNYSREPINNNLPSTSQFNFGFNYRPFPWIEISTSRERGELWMVRVSLRANFNDKGIPKIDPAPPELKPRKAILAGLASTGGGPVVLPRKSQHNDANSDLNAVFADFTRQGLVLDSVSFEGGFLDINFQSNNDISGLSADDMGSLLARFVEHSFPDAQHIAVSFTGGPGAQTSRPLDQGVGVVRSVAPVSAPVSQPRSRPLPTHEIATRIFEELDEEGLAAEGFELREGEAILHFSPTKYRQTARSVGRAARVVANNVPPDIELITLVLSAAGMELSRITILRHDLEMAVSQSGSPEEVWVRAQVLPPAIDEESSNIIHNGTRFPAFDYSVGPRLRQHIGSRDGFMLYQLFLAFSGRVELAPGLSISGSVGADVTNNFNRLTVDPPASQVPRVRSFIREYLQQGQNNLIRLQTDYMFSPAPDLYARLSAGYFEDMFGGFGGEVLFRPFGSRFAGGIDLNYVRQRDFDQRFTFRDYSVATGHVNLYYDLPFKDILAQANIGRFLAGDIGAKFQFSRVFAGGVRVGAWATLTDMPFAVFGEGSFDKGFFVVIPFDLLSVRSTTRSGTFAFRPLTKDGGQLLGIVPRLYDVTAGGNLDNVSKDWDRLLD
ncbi:MAG: YjbH domain-containing protein [Alphaproteobacteria bacterium]